MKGAGAGGNNEGWNPAETGRGFWMKYAALCGFLGPAIYVAVVLILGVITPGYSQATRLMSELGEAGAPYAVAMNSAGFLLFGILLIIFSLGLGAALRPSPARTVGVILVAAAGITYIGEAVFSCDRGCVPVTPAGTAHLLIGDLAVVIGVLASLVLAVAMKPDVRWKGYWQYSLVTGILVVAFLPLFGIFYRDQGMVQRLVVGVILLWQAVIALRAYSILAEMGGGTEEI